MVRRIWLGQPSVRRVSRHASIIRFICGIYADVVLIPVELAFIESGQACIFARGRSIDTKAKKRPEVPSLSGTVVLRVRGAIECLGNVARLDHFRNSCEGAS